MDSRVDLIFKKIFVVEENKDLELHTVELCKFTDELPKASKTNLGQKAILISHI